MVDLWWLVIQVRQNVDRGELLCVGDGWHEKKENKHLKYHLLGHNISITNQYMGNIDGNHADHIHIYQECRGYMLRINICMLVEC